MDKNFKKNYGKKGQELASWIANTDPQLVQKVKQAAAKGDTQAALALLAPLLADPKVRMLAKDLEDSHGK